jgi:signal transduction histidine kinase
MHEFRTHLSVISIASKVLQSDGIEFSLRLKQYAGIVKSQTDQLQEKVSRILEFALSEEKHSIFTKKNWTSTAL